MPLDQLGPYRIERLLGRGGMGSVYVGVHDQTGQRAAIKVLAEHLGEDPRFQERFRAEVDTLKRLRHKNIVTLHGFGQEQGRLFFVMELVEGESLESELRAGRRYTWHEAADIGVQVCAALKHAHDHGVVHRDLKPANLLMTDDGTVKLTDFGIAKLFGATHLTMVGSMIGTPDYMSPEQTEGAPVTQRSDLYSLGCVLYALLSGEPPFFGGSLTALIERVRYQKPRPLRSVATGIPDEFDRIVRQLLRKRPEDRIATPQLLANLLQAMKHALLADTSSRHAIADASAPDRDAAAASPQPAGDDGPKLTRLSTSERPTVDLTPEEKLRMKEAHDESSCSDPSTARTLPSAGGMEPAPDGTVAEEEPASHFTPVSGDEWRTVISQPEGRRGDRRDRWIVAALATSLIGIALACIVAFWPVSADRLYQRIEHLSRADPTSDDYGRLMKEFLERFPDDRRRATVETLRADYQCRTLLDELNGKLRNLSEEEKLFIKGMQLVAQGNAKDAEECFTRIVTRLADTPLGASERRLVARARHMLNRLTAADDGSRSPPDAHGDGSG